MCNIYHYDILQVSAFKESKLVVGVHDHAVDGSKGRKLQADGEEGDQVTSIDSYQHDGKHPPKTDDEAVGPGCRLVNSSCTEYKSKADDQAVRLVNKNIYKNCTKYIYKSLADNDVVRPGDLAVPLNKINPL